MPEAHGGEDMAGRLRIAFVCVLWLAGCAAEPVREAPLATRVEPPVGFLEHAGVMEDAASERSPVTSRQAPGFTLMDQDEKPVSLSDLRGQWVVLYFYPKDDTPGCACQANEFTALLTQFRQMNADVYGVSADSPALHRAFIAKYDLALNLLSDPDKSVMRTYGAWVDTALGDQQYGRVIRSTMIIDPEGRIAHHWPEVIPEGHAERVKDKLEELQGSYL